MGYELKLYIGIMYDRSEEVSYDADRRDYFHAHESEHGKGQYYAFEADGNTKFRIPSPCYKGRYFEDIAMVDLCKPGYSSHIHKLDQSIELAQDDCKHDLVYFYADDRNTKVFVDVYDKTLRYCDADLALDALNADVETSEYRRFPIAQAMLKEAINKFGSENLTVVLFGY
jgi:hypothetical protein